jgi:amino acid adenylation domain-containing protein
MATSGPTEATFERSTGDAGAAEASAGSRGEPSTGASVLVRLTRAGVQLWTENGELHFAAPEGGVPSNLRREATRHKKAILDCMKEDRRYVVPSFVQQRMWFFQQLFPSSTAYNVCHALRLEGPLNVAALRNSLHAIARRHEPLRTTFESIDGKPVQTIHSSPRIQLPLVDCSELPPDRREPEARRQISWEGQRAFDLSRDLPIRGRLIRLTPTTHYFALTLHHVASDKWSVELLFEEIYRFYDQFVTNGTADPVPESPSSVAYSDYAVWEQLRLTEGSGRRLSDSAQSRLQDWTDALADVSPLRLPTDRPRSEASGVQCDSMSVSVPASDALRSLATTEGVTLFSAALAGLEATLARESGQTDFAVGTPVSGRDRTELETLIGCFVGTLALPNDAHGSLSFRDLIRRVHQTVVAAKNRSDIPFERVVNALDRDQHPNRHPLFQVMFDVGQTAHQKGRQESSRRLGSPSDSASGSDGSAVRVEPLSTGTPSSEFDLTVQVEAEEEIRLHWKYRTDLFNPSTVERMARRMARLLTAAAEDPDRPVADLPIFSDDERRKLDRWSRGPVLGTDTRPVPEQMAAQAEETPDRVAVVGSDGKHHTYRALQAQATRLADRLRPVLSADSVSDSEPIVAVLPDASPSSLAALWAVWKAGAAYLPLNPSAPAGRLRTVLQEARPDAVLAGAERSAAVDAVLDSSGTTVLPIQATGSSHPLHSASPNDADADTPPPDRLAYLLYTSGTTGTPKGVTVSHGNLAHHMTWFADEGHVRVGDCLLQKTPWSFDASGWEFFAPLTMGARLVLTRPGAHRDPDRIEERLVQERITVLQAVPSQWRLLVGTGALEETRALRRVYSGGEALSWSLQEEICAQIPGDPALTNLYGPTETTIDATLFAPRPAPGPSEKSEIDRSEIDRSEIDHSKRDGSETVPIGRPVAGTRAYVLDPETLAPLPVGVPGELVLGGPQVARGYRGRPRQTAEAFVPDPFAEEESFGEGSPTGARMYRTGDRVRWTEEGELEYLGRIDRQVQVRGVRVEPGEVEAALEALGGVAQAVVVARGEGSDTRLVGYVVAAEDQTGREEDLDEEALRETLAERLGRAKVPARIVAIDTIPLTDSGKADYDVLPEPDAREERDYEPPQTETEKELAKIWAEVLGLDRVGRTDDFFRLGGHSLLAMQVVGRIRNRLDTDVEVRDLFIHTELARFSQFVEKQSDARAAEPSLADDEQYEEGVL